MRKGSALKVATALFLTVLLSLFVVDATKAEEQNQETNSAAAQIIGRIPQPGAYGLIMWGGGSTLQLMTRLSQGGCDVRSIWETRSHRSLSDFEYGVSYFPGASSKLNNAFLRRFPNANIPAGQLLVVVCEERASVSPDHMSNSDICGDNWADLVRRHMFSRVAFIDGLCLAMFATEEEAKDALEYEVSSPGQYFSRYSYLVDEDGQVELSEDVFRPAVLTITRYPESSYHSIWAQIHGACHAQQEWYVYKSGLQDKNRDLFWWEVWNATPAGEALIETLDIELVDGEWKFPEGDAFSGMGFEGPSEVATEICALYFLRDIERATFPDPASFDEYLTDEIVAWVEAYIAVIPR